MNGTGKLLTMVIVGILIAAAIIGGVTALQRQNILPPGGPTTITTSRTIVSTSTSIETSTSTEISNSTIPKGNLATQLSAIVNLPVGVSHVYVKYSDIEVHTLGFGNFSLWVTSAKGGIIDLSGLSNLGYTIANSQVVSGRYDLARFSLIAANITYLGRNVSASVPLQLVTVPIGQQGIQVQPNSTSGFVFVFAPTIVPFQRGSNTTYFQVVPYAKAVTIPSSISTALFTKVGSRINLTSAPWFTGNQEELSGNVTILLVVITSDALVVFLKNTGNSNVTISGLSLLATNASTANVITTTIVTTITTVTTITQVNTGTNPAIGLPAASSAEQGARAATGLATEGYQTVASFLVLNNKQIIQPAQSSTGFNGTLVGLVLTPGSNASLTYIGDIATMNSAYSPYSPLGIIPGQEYALQIISPFGKSLTINQTAINPFQK